MKTIWVIDDEPAEQILIQYLLKKIRVSLEFRFFSDPQIAIETLESQDLPIPQLIICDFKMRGMSGIDFLDWLRHSRFGAVPVAIRSNSDHPEDIRAAYQHGANCYIQKGSTNLDLQRNFRLLIEFWSRMCVPEPGAMALSLHPLSCSGRYRAFR
jgi:CheY-like chemotaxis protein